MSIPIIFDPRLKFDLGFKNTLLINVSIAGPRHLSKWTKVFCFNGSIESGQEATFNDCTKQQNNYYLQP